MRRQHAEEGEVGLLLHSLVQPTDHLVVGVCGEEEVADLLAAGHQAAEVDGQVGDREHPGLLASHLGRDADDAPRRDRCQEGGANHRRTVPTAQQPLDHRSPHGVAHEDDSAEVSCHRRHVVGIVAQLQPIQGVRGRTAVATQAQGMDLPTRVGQVRHDVPGPAPRPVPRPVDQQDRWPFGGLPRRKHLQPRDPPSPDALTVFEIGHVDDHAPPALLPGRRCAAVHHGWNGLHTSLAAAVVEAIPRVSAGQRLSGRRSARIPSVAGVDSIPGDLPAPTLASAPSSRAPMHCSSGG